MGPEQVVLVLSDRKVAVLVLVRGGYSLGSEYEYAYEYESE